MLTDHGPLQARIAHPKWKRPAICAGRRHPDAAALDALRKGVAEGRLTKPAQVDQIDARRLADPPVRFRKTVPAWLRITIREAQPASAAHDGHVSLPTCG